jgi:hypothetical protein
MTRCGFVVAATAHHFSRGPARRTAGLAKIPPPGVPRVAAHPSRHVLADRAARPPATARTARRWPRPEMRQRESWTIRRRLGLTETSPGRPRVSAATLYALAHTYAISTRRYGRCRAYPQRSFKSALALAMKLSGKLPGHSRPDRYRTPARRPARPRPGARHGGLRRGRRRARPGPPRPPRERPAPSRRAGAASNIRQLTDVLLCNLQEICPASTGETCG